MNTLVIFKRKGFTLIELLVVISIIGLLSAVVMVSVNTARSRGNDVAIKKTLVQARNQADLFYSNNNGSYSGVCTQNAVSATGNTPSIYPMVLNAAKLAGLSGFSVVLATAGAGNVATCHINASGSAWAVDVPLKGSTVASPKMLCADSLGKMKERTSVLAANAVDCN